MLMLVHKKKSNFLEVALMGEYVQVVLLPFSFAIRPLPNVKIRDLN